jgi:hypothetical protein
MILTAQEKVLDYHTHTLTVEYMQNPITQERGDWFSMAAQYYFVGYTNPNHTEFTEWVIVDWLKMAVATIRGLKWTENANKNGRARASFKYVLFKDIPTEAILFGNILKGNAHV